MAENINGASATRNASMYGDGFYEDALTPEALFIYISSRLQSVDQRIDDVLDRQKATEAARSALRNVDAALNGFPSNDMDPNEKIGEVPQGNIEELEAALARLDAVAPEEAKAIRADLASKNIYTAAYTTKEVPAMGDEAARIPDPANAPAPQQVEHPASAGGYTSLDLTGIKESIARYSKDLESTASLDMIQLQSFMSARQTAIQLATNVSASLAESIKAVVSNVGR